jgi:hypothetical protein
VVHVVFVVGGLFFQFVSLLPPQASTRPTGTRHLRTIHCRGRCFRPRPRPLSSDRLEFRGRLGQQEAVTRDMGENRYRVNHKPDGRNPNDSGVEEADFRLSLSFAQLLTRIDHSLHY